MDQSEIDALLKMSRKKVDLPPPPEDVVQELGPNPPGDEEQAAEIENPQAQPPDEVAIPTETPEAYACFADEPAPATKDFEPIVDEGQPDILVSDFQKHSHALDGRLDELQDMITQIREELRGDTRRTLYRLAHVAKAMADGQVYQKIDIEAKGEIGQLVHSLNQTLQNLQQLDASVKEQSTQVPELAAQLDTITQNTEEATQSVMNRLDSLMAAADSASRQLGSMLPQLQEQDEARRQALQQIEHFLERASQGEEPMHLAQDILDYLFALQGDLQVQIPDLAPAQKDISLINDEAFEILNTMQFQDITRQKIEKVVQLLKQFQSGLNRLLEIFKIHSPEGKSEIFDHRRIGTQDRIFEVSLEADSRKESVEDIISSYKKGK